MQVTRTLNRFTSRCIRWTGNRRRSDGVLTIAKRVCEVLSLLFDRSVSATMWFIFLDLTFRLQPIIESTLSDTLLINLIGSFSDLLMKIW